MENEFVGHDALTENGAVSNSTSGSHLVDQFGKASTQRGRSYEEVAKDQEAIWNEDKELSIRFIFYLRMVTRKVKIRSNSVTEKVQNGQGVRDESFKRLLWLAYNHPKEFYKNVWLLPVVGSWKDLFTLLLYDFMHEKKIDRHKIYDILNKGLTDDTQCDLIKKYMPRIVSVKKRKTERELMLNGIACSFARYNGWNIVKYNKLKVSGTAHDFQKKICAREYEKLEWGKIPGRALSILVSSNFIKNHSLGESYEKWLMAQPVAKFTGYPFELGARLRRGGDIPYVRHTIDKQFESLIQTSKQGGAIQGNVWCALDTSGSMSWSGNISYGGNLISALAICKSLGIFFSTLNQGAFHKNVIMFDDESYVKQLNGTFCEMWEQIPDNAWGGTDFISVVNTICDIREKHPEIPLKDYPSTLLVVSDMQFNGNSSGLTNQEHALALLSAHFPKEFVDDFKFIWWNVTSRAEDVPTKKNDNNTFFIGGFDGSVITMLLGGEEKKAKTPVNSEELMRSALSQEVLNLVQV